MNSPQRETGGETDAGGPRDQRQPEGIVGHFLCFVPFSYVTPKCSGRQRDRQSHMQAAREDGKLGIKEDERRPGRGGGRR